MKEEKYIKALEATCEKGGFREFLKAPFNRLEYPNNTFASDAHVMLITPNTDAVLNTQFEISNVYNPERNTNIEIITSELRAEMDSSEKLPIYKEKMGECPACNGSGNVEWSFEYDGEDYSEYFDCPVCDGSGKSMIKSDEIDHYEYDPKNIVIIGNSPFQFLTLEKLLNVANILEVGTITLFCQREANRASYFQLGDCEMLVMPCMINDNGRVVSRKYEQ